MTEEELKIEEAWNTLKDESCYSYYQEAIGIIRQYINNLENKVNHYIIGEPNEF